MCSSNLARYHGGHGRSTPESVHYAAWWILENKPLTKRKQATNRLCAWLIGRLYEHRYHYQELTRYGNRKILAQRNAGSNPGVTGFKYPCSCAFMARPSRDTNYLSPERKCCIYNLEFFYMGWQSCQTTSQVLDWVFIILEHIYIQWRYISSLVTQTYTLYHQSTLQYDELVWSVRDSLSGIQTIQL